MVNLANILTVARLLLLPFIMVLCFIPGAWAAWLCLGLYVIGAITDFLDGWVARKYNQITPFGTFLDPISDKIFVATILLILVATDRIEGVFVLAVAVILAREFLVAGLREFLGPRNIQIPVTQLAKWKTAIQMVATGFLIVAPLSAALKIAGLAGLVGAAALTALTGWQYLRAAWPHIRG